MDIYIFIHINIHIHMYICLYICIYIHMYILGNDEEVGVIHSSAAVEGKHVMIMHYIPRSFISQSL
jgi:hypothetical protein